MPIFFHARSTDFGPYEQARLQAPTLRSLFSDLPAYLDKIPPSDRWDMYFSLAETRTPRKRDQKGEQPGTWARENWIKQEAFGWDLDAILDEDLHKHELYMEVMAEYLGCAPDEMTVIRSGHGFQFLLFLEKPIEDFEFFEKNRALYKHGLDEIRRMLKARGLSGDPDHRVFDYARIFRLPGTENRKREPFVPCRLIQLSLVKHSINLAELLDLPAVPESDALSDQELTQIHRAIDVPAVLSECQFLAWTREQPLDVKEPEGYAALSVLGRLDPTQKLATEYYARWTNSSSLQRQDPQRKIEQAVQNSGPRTCQSIHQMWAKGPGCATCPHFGKIKSPILITSENFVATEADGFYTLLRDKQGNVKKRTPAYDDLLRAFIREKKYFCQPENEQIWTFNGTHYQREHELSVKGWCEQKMLPRPQTTVRNEFYNKVCVNELKSQDQFKPLFEATMGKINLSNGVLDAQTKTLSPHSPHFGFKYVLPYAYDPHATAPLFLKFLQTLACNDHELVEALLDFLAYCLWPGYQGIEPAFWWLSGTGSNGKSKFLDMMALVLGGVANTAHFKPRNFGVNDRFSLANLDGKLMCVVEEVNDKHLDIDMLGVLKDLCAGGTIQVEQKGKTGYSMRNSAKFIFTSNQQPIITDQSHGLERRFVVVPFKMNFDAPGVQKDPDIVSKMQHELPGILNLGLIALQKMIDRGRKPFFPTSGNAERDEMLANSDSVRRWMEERIIVTGDETDFIASKEAYDDYKKSMDHENCVSSTTFGMRIRAKIPAALRKQAKRRVNGGIPVRGFAGIQYKAVSDSEY